MAHLRLLESEARIATTNTAAQQISGKNAWKGVILFLDVTTGASSETLTPQVQMYDPISETWENITAFGATASAFTGEKIYVIYPGAVETSAITDQEVAGIPIPDEWRVAITHSSTGSWVYSLSASYIP